MQVTLGDDGPAGTGATALGNLEQLHCHQPTNLVSEMEGGED